MKHFYSFLKRKGLFIDVANTTVDSQNGNAVHQLNHELMEVGYVLTGNLFKALSMQTLEFINNVRTELIDSINEILPQGGGVIIYRSFPHDVPNANYSNVMNGLNAYFNSGVLTDIGEHIPSGFTFEPKTLKKVDLLTESELNSIFTDLLYSAKSISANDKKIVDYFIDNGYDFDFSKITFNETKAYVGKRLMENDSIKVLPVSSATTVLRIYAVYSNGDEGLKENVKFVKPSKRIVKLLSATLDKCYDLEESFKMYREVWLRVLFYLNPLTTKNKFKYPNLYKYANALRNNPKSLKTFNSYVEEGFKNKDVKVLDILKTRSGVFGRRLDHAVRVFGEKAVESFLATKVKFTSLVDNYNHFSTRDKASDRSAILASSSASNLVTYGALEALPTKTVEAIKAKFMDKMNTLKHPLLTDKKVYIDRTLYYRPMVDNNRGSSLSLGQANGTVETIDPKAKTLRLYVEWFSTDDIDLSAFAIDNTNNVVKIGWNGLHNVGYAEYSGDNTGRSSTQNEEYIDITLDQVPSNVEWIVSDARVYRGNTYKDFRNGSPKAGFMTLVNAGRNAVSQKDSVKSGMVLSADSKNAFLVAYNVKHRAIVFLDLASSGGSISNGEDALKIRTYLEKIAVFDNGSPEIDWSRINQGHVINLLATTVVDNPEDADIVFDENTTFEEVAKYL